MNTGLDLEPVPAAERRATFRDVALVFAGANIVTTTLVTGGALGQQVTFPAVFWVLAAGLLVGTLPIAWLARLGPRYGVPTMVLLRSVFGRRGAAAIALLLVVTNFAWIALNNAIAARALARLLPGGEPLWAAASGGMAVLIALWGPRATAHFDRVAVPLLGALGLVLSVRLFAMPLPPLPRAPFPGAGNILVTLDLVVGYQISWSLMFADYTRTLRHGGGGDGARAERRAAWAVFAGLGLTSAWLMALGARAFALSGSPDPTEMVLAAGLPAVALVVVVLSTVTTNFVNLYLSGLAVRSLWPAARPVAVLVVIGAIGTALGMLDPNLLDRYAGFMGLLGTLLLPIVAVAVVHFVRASAGAGPSPAWSAPGLVAWLAGVASYRAVLAWAPQLGATLPTLLVSALCYLALRRRGERRAAACATPS